MATIDDGKFFRDIRLSLFSGSLEQPQVDGINAMLASCRSPDGAFLEDMHWSAYKFGTAYLETGKTMQPINEYGGPVYFKRMYDIEGDRPDKARELGNLTPGDGVLFHGRGYVQLTGRRNYRVLGERIAVDLEVDPDKALEAETAARIMTIGMREGLFTGRKLGDYFPPDGQPQWVEARRIINGLDRAHDVAAYAQMFYSAFQASLAAA